MRVQVYRTMDMGFTNPTVCLWIGVTDDDDWIIFQEMYETGQTADYYAGKINAMSQGMNIVATYGDPSAAQVIAEFAQRGIYVTPATKEVGTAFNTWVRFKIDKVAEKLKLKPGKPRIDGRVDTQGAPSIYIYPTCINTIREFETYRWKEKSVTQAQDLNEPDVPEKANDHAMDALSYFACSYQKPFDSEYDNINKGLRDKWKL